MKVGRSASVRIAEIDHRFRGLKMCNPNLKTVMVISSKEEELSKMVVEKAKVESFDTDIILSINEVEKLLSIIK